MKSRSIHHVRIACSRVVCTRKMRLLRRWRRSRKRQSMRLSWALSAAIGVSGRAARGDLERADLDLDTAELDALVVLELAVHGEEGAGRERRDGVGEREGVGVLRFRSLDRFDGGAGRGVHQLHRAGLVAEDDELHLLLIPDGLDPPRNRDGAVGKGLQLLHKNALLTRIQCMWHPLAPMMSA